MKKNNSTHHQYKALPGLCFVLFFSFAMLFTLLRCFPIETDAQEQSGTNILLIGQDRREGENRARSDCMILCTFSPDRRTLTMTSFLRDLYVDIPGHGRNRLNAAYAFGGSPLLAKTLQENFGIVTDGCAEVDFSQFPRLIDLMGGVTLDLRQDEAETVNAEIPGSQLQEGSQTLTGQQALSYVRIRSLDSDGDFSRTNRQRKILMALMKNCQGTSLSQLLQLFRTASPMLTTDIPQWKLLSLIGELAPMLPNMEILSQHIPIEGSYAHRMVDSMAVLIADMEVNRSFLRQSLGS